MDLRKHTSKGREGKGRGSEGEREGTEEGQGKEGREWMGREGRKGEGRGKREGVPALLTVHFKHWMSDELKLKLYRNAQTG